MARPAVCSICSVRTTQRADVKFTNTGKRSRVTAVTKYTPPACEKRPLRKSTACGTRTIVAELKGEGMVGFGLVVRGGERVRDRKIGQRAGLLQR
jgi:hypothetical protein